MSGLCDQYEGPNQCDSDFSSPHFVLDAQMGAAQQRQVLYLLDDDITGIRRFLTRDSFTPWPEVHAGMSETPPAIALEAIEYLRIHSAQLESDAQLVVRFGAWTHVETEFIFELYEATFKRWVTLPAMFQVEAGGFKQLNANLGVNLKNGFNAENVRLTLRSKNASQPAVRTIEMAVDKRRR